jgi:hypothetical protein
MNPMTPSDCNPFDHWVVTHELMGQLRATLLSTNLWAKCLLIPLPHMFLCTPTSDGPSYVNKYTWTGFPNSQVFGSLFYPSRLYPVSLTVQRGCQQPLKLLPFFCLSTKVTIHRLWYTDLTHYQWLPKPFCSSARVVEWVTKPTNVWNGSTL